MNMTKLTIVAIAASFLSLSLQHVFASGAYVTNSGGARTGDYNIGKSIFNGRAKIGGYPSCKSCHKGKEKLKRKKLKVIKNTLKTVILDCDNHAQCYKDTLNEPQISQLVNYIIKRFRL